MRKIYLRANNVSLKYPSHGDPSLNRPSLWQKLLGIKLREFDSVAGKSLSDINLSLNAGDRLGLVGHNGAGKTTLLRVLAGGIPPIKGEITSSGKIVSLLNRTQGMSLEANGYENIILRGIYLGYSINKMQAKADKIIEFSELEKHIYKPIRTYSAGMRARLSFSIMMESEPDILLIDEWLGAGDRQFREKANKGMNELLEKAGIIVFATHSERLMNGICNQTITMENGRIIKENR